MSQTFSLYRLQQVDSQIDHAQARLQDIRQSLEDDTGLRLAREKALSTKVTWQSADRNLKLAELNANSQHIKIEQTEASLYAGKGHNPKELLDLQNDVAALKRHLDKLEEIQIEAMLAIEDAMASYHAAESNLQLIQNQSAEQNLYLHQEQSTLQKELEKLFSERAAIAGSIPTDALNLYAQLRFRGNSDSTASHKPGLAVAVISDKSCSACGAGLSAAQMQSSRSPAQISLCPSCGRILYGS
jgi:predicted  nucleic acid-binding Zn-ribbon protein